MEHSVRQCLAIFLTSVAFGLLLRCGHQMWPEGIFSVLAPHSSSVWELSKIALWPPLLAALLHHAQREERGSLCAYLMVPAAMPVTLLFLLWFLRMVCGICNGLVDMTLWVCLLAVGDCMALSVRKTVFVRRALPMVAVIVLVWVCAYTVFSLRVPDLPIFTEYFPYASATIAW